MTTDPPAAHPRRFTPLHAYLALAAWILAAGLIFLVTYLGSDKHENRPAIAAVTALFAPLGPLTAGIARHGQACCVQFAAECVPYALPFLLIAFLPFFARPAGRLLRFVSYAIWTLGLFTWCASGLFPLVAHSLN